MTQRHAASRTPIAAYADLGRALLARRVELDASRREIEAALGWPKGHLRLLELGRRCFSEATLGSLLDLLGLQLRLHAEGAPYVACKTYPELILALVARRRALGLSQEAVSEMAGVPDRYVNKIEANMRMLGPLSLPTVLGALRLTLFVEPRPAFRWRAPEPPFFGAGRASYVILPSEIAA